MESLLPYPLAQKGRRGPRPQQMLADGHTLGLCCNTHWAQIGACASARDQASPRHEASRSWPPPFLSATPPGATSSSRVSLLPPRSVSLTGRPSLPTPSKLKPLPAVRPTATLATSRPVQSPATMTRASSLFSSPPRAGLAPETLTLAASSPCGGPPQAKRRCQTCPYQSQLRHVLKTRARRRASLRLGAPRRTPSFRRRRPPQPRLRGRHGLRLCCHPLALARP